MTPTCPTCGKPIDPLRAPVARIAAGRIVTYCSKECAEPDVAKVALAAAAASDKLTAAAPKPPAPVKKAEPSPVAKITPPPAEMTRPEPPPARPPTPPRVDVSPEEEERPKSEADRRRRRNRRVVWLAAGIITGGMAVAVIQTVSPSSPAPVDAEREATPPDAAPVKPPPPAPPPGPPALDVHDTDAVRDRAESDLRALLPAVGSTAKVSRIEREAALALSRTSDHTALEVLARSMAEEDQAIARLQIAYALARAGDKRGQKALYDALGKGPRDPRAEAATYLAMLGDDHGASVLDTMLEVQQLEIGAAVALAPLHDKHALQILEKVRADQDPLHKEDRWRALVALGKAGVKDVQGDLEKLLDDKDIDVGAAEALARLGDKAAVPVLEDELDKPSLQVDAALGLRRLDPNLDPSPYLPRLIAQLDAGKDTAKVSAAEAILILTGPANLAEHD